MKKIILILFCLICILSFSDVYALQGKILSINKEKNIALIKEEPKLNFFERILSFFNLKKQETIIYEVSLNSEKINTVDSFLFFQQKKEQPIQDVSVGDVIEITNVFENIIKKENSPTYDTTDLNYNYDSIFSGFANTPTTIFKESDKVGIMVTTKPSIDSKVECLSNKDCMFCNGACISVLKAKNISYCNNVPPSNLSCVCKDGFCLKNISNDYIISQETKHCTFRENPVCGVDNTTYLNECFAKAANVEIACNKTCPCTESTTTTIYTTTTTVSTTTTIPSTTTTVPLPTTTIPNQESIKVTCEMFGGVWYSSKQECQKTNLEDMDQFEEWCLLNNGFFTDNVPCPKGEICLAVVTAGCNFSSPYTTTTTTILPPTTIKPPFPTTTIPGTTSTTHPQIFPPKDFKCAKNSDCANFKPQECPDLQGIICQYECLDDHCVWIVKEENLPTTTTKTTTTTTTVPLPTVPKLPPNTYIPTYPEPPLKQVCPVINYVIPCFNHNDCQIQLNHLINEKGEYVQSNCIPRCVNGKCQILDIGVDGPIDMSPEPSDHNLIEDIYFDFLSLKSMFANIFKLK